MKDTILFHGVIATCHHVTLIISRGTCFWHTILLTVTTYQCIFSLVLYVDFCFSLVLYVDLCFSLVLYVDLCFSLVLYVDLCFSLVLYVDLCPACITDNSLRDLTG
jgi:hypothetical protein